MGAGHAVTYWILGGLLIFCLIFAHQRKFDTLTPLSRLDLLRSLTLEHTVCIDAYRDNTPDKAVFHGHYFSDKAPGTVAIALPPFAASIYVLKWAGVPLDSHGALLFSSWFSCASSLATVTAGGGVALFAWLGRFVPARTALLTVLCLFLGAAPLPYSTMLFSHAMVIGLICIAIWALRVGVEREEREDRGERIVKPRYGLAGFCCGLALASEFSSGLVVAALFVWLLASDRRCAVRFALAALPPLLLIPAYSLACFGDPFTLPYSLQASFPEMKQGVYAIQWPDPVTAWNLVIAPTRGLLFWTPFLVLAVFGYATLARKSLGLFALTCTLPLVHFFAISGRSWDWPAGYVLGPRLLAPMLPLLALPCALAAQRWPLLGALLACYSIAVTSLGTLTDATPTLEYYNPLTELHLPLLFQGLVSPNLGAVIGLRPLASIVLFYLVLVAGALWLRARLHPARPYAN